MAGVLFKGSSTITPPVGVTPKKLRKDKCLTEWDTFAFDAMHPVSWPSQGAPAVADKVHDLSGDILSLPDDTNLAAVFTGTPAPAFSSAGFKFALASTSYLQLPTAGVRPAATSNGWIAMCWMIIPELGPLRRGFGWFNTAGTSSYGFYYNNVTRQLVVYYDGGTATVTLNSNNFVGGFARLLFCLGRCEDGAGGYLRKRRIYCDTPGAAGQGVSNTASAASGVTSAQSNGASRIGYDSALGAGIVQSALRFRMVDVKTAVGVMTSAKFDELCLAEYDGNKQRADWSFP